MPVFSQNAVKSGAVGQGIARQNNFRFVWCIVPTLLFLNCDFATTHAPSEHHICRTKWTNTIKLQRSFMFTFLKFQCGQSILIRHQRYRLRNRSALIILGNFVLWSGFWPGMVKTVPTKPITQIVGTVLSVSGVAWTNMFVLAYWTLTTTIYGFLW